MRLAGKVAIVTGAASGIGRAIALRFAAEGAHVVVGDVREGPREGGERTIDLIRGAGGSGDAIRLDVADWISVEGVVQDTAFVHGHLDVMVNNAAIGIDKPLLETDEADWNRVMDVNLKGVFFGCKAAVAAMLAQGAGADGARGRIINISSQHGMVAAPGDIAYGVSKAGVVYITRQIAADYAARGIVCNAVAPGKILTGKEGPAAAPETLAYSRSRTPMDRLGQPEDVAGAALFLASAEATYIQGENLMVDGGWMAS